MCPLSCPSCSFHTDSPVPYERRKLSWRLPWTHTSNWGARNEIHFCPSLSELQKSVTKSTGCKWPVETWPHRLWETNEDRGTVLASKYASAPRRQGTLKKSFTYSTHPWMLPLLLEDHKVRGQNKLHGTERSHLSLWISACVWQWAALQACVMSYGSVNVFLWTFGGQEMKMELYKWHVSYLEEFALRRYYSSSNTPNSRKLQMLRCSWPNRRRVGTSLGHS